MVFHRSALVILLLASAVSAAEEDFRASLDARRGHWAWQPVTNPPLPEVHGDIWSRYPVDRFLRVQLDAAGLRPSLRATERALLRRVSFDLVGLPPSPQDVAAYLQDASPNRFEKIVDRFLASPHFGERWGRHWLDVVRYAESRGHERDYTIPNAFQYRDYVIRALNDDVPYDRFVREHIAGDLLDPPRLNRSGEFNESILGTGFWYLGDEVHSPVDIRADETDRTDNKIDVFSKAFLGMTVACARCHDHKFDAISTRDYYALAGYLLSVSYRQVRFETMEHNRHIAHQIWELESQNRPQVTRAVVDAMRPVLSRLAEYLMASRGYLQVGGRGDLAPRDAASADEEKLLPKINRDLLQNWVQAIERAAERAEDPLHDWSRFVDANKGRDVSPQAGLTELPANARVIVDYANLEPNHWRQNGFAFGARPVVPGDVRFGAEFAQPITSVFAFSAARSDSLWNALQAGPAAEKDSGRVNWQQAGRTIRTPTFTLTSGRLYYLVQGSGYAYAAVNLHRMLNGPLHKALTLDWRGDERPHWIEHDLTDYPGHRVHIELSPRPPESPKDDKLTPELAILMVIESDTPPEDPQAASQFPSTLESSDFESHATLAQAYQRQFTAAANRFAAQSIGGDDTAAADAEMVGWMVEHPELWTTPDSAARSRLVARCAPFVKQRQQLIQSIQRSSQLAPVCLDGNGVNEFALRRGNPKTPGPPVPRRGLAALRGNNSDALPHTSGRLQLARQVTQPDNPLVARVWVNRVWHHLFGRGIVASVDNFGALGQRPSNPRLLDSLAHRFIQEGWSTKRLVRRLVLSQTYQMSSSSSSEGASVDPDNRLWHRMPIRRLEGECVRDAILAVSGRLDTRLYGPSVPVHLNPFMEGRGRPESGPRDGAGRRSVYLSVRRNFLESLFLAFDFPLPFTAHGRRNVSNVPAQALSLMNSPFVFEQSKRWGQRVIAAEVSSHEDRIDALFQSAFARPPHPEERLSAHVFLNDQSQRYACPIEDPRVWADLCHVLINLKEFIYIR